MVLLKQVIDKINKMSRGNKNNELLNSKRTEIVETGQLRKGTYRPPQEIFDKH